MLHLGPHRRQALRHLALRRLAHLPLQLLEVPVPRIDPGRGPVATAHRGRLGASKGRWSSALASTASRSSSASPAAAAASGQAARRARRTAAPQHCAARATARKSSGVSVVEAWKARRVRQSASSGGRQGSSSSSTCGLREDFLRDSKAFPGFWAPFDEL